MDKIPKRRKRKDNPYTIFKNGDTYKISFKDNQGRIQKVDITKEIYEVFNEFELMDKSLINEEERYFERLELSEELIHKRAFINPIALLDEVVLKDTLNKLKIALNSLPEIQKKRIEMYYFNSMTFQQIAQKEGCTKRAVKFSIDLGIEKMKKILKNL